LRIVSDFFHRNYQALFAPTGHTVIAKGALGHPEKSSAPLRGRTEKGRIVFPQTKQFSGYQSLTLLDPELQSDIPAGIKNPLVY
jgi:hypothetical protein